MKFDLEIAIDQQTRACDRTFERVTDSAILPKHLNMLITKILGALLVASGPLNSYKKFHQDWTKND